MRRNTISDEFKRRVLVLTIPLLCSVSAMAQNIRGTVVDATTNEPIIGAAVSLKGDKSEKTIAVTDINGNFTVDIKKYPVTLSIGFTGYTPEEYDIYEATNEKLQVELKENFNSLNEVVVVGYGSQKRKELTGSIATVDKSLLDQKVTSFDELLGGTVAGLNVSESSGQPGSQSSIRIRGGNSINAGNEPLYVIDGVLVYNSSEATNTGISFAETNFNPLASINPSDIESIEVLKDVSASAIYGSRGANGVIIITTKKGKKGAVKVDYGYNVGISKVRKKLDLLNAEQWGNLYLDLATDAQKKATGVTPEVVSTWGEGTDWEDAVFRTSVSQQHQLSVSGGSDKERFLISGNYTDQNGIIRSTDFTRLGARINYERDIFKNVTVGLVSNFSKSTQKGAYSFSGLNANGFSGLLEQALRTSPAVPIYNADGTFNYENPFESGDFVRNGRTPNAIADLHQVQTKTTSDNLLLSGFVSWGIVKGLNLRVQGSTNIINTHQDFFGPATSTAGFDTNGYASIGSKRWESDQFEATLTWNKTWNIHQLEVLGGYTYQQEKSQRELAASANFANENLGYKSLQSGSQLISPQSEFITSVLYSGIGRVNYSLLDRYHLTATLRADGSSRFAKNKKWGWFPSVGLSWNVNDENWLKNVKWIEDLKVRASIGTVGNQEIGDYTFLSTYGTTHYYLGSGTKNIAYYRSQLGNDDLKWETTTSYDVGLDFNVLRGRLGFVFDFYHKKTSDLLLTIPVEQTTGFTSQITNVGNVTNDGVEFSVNAAIFQRKDFSWNASANIAHNKNKVTSIGTQQTEIIQGSTIIRVGEALGTYYGWVFDGVVQKGDDLSKVPAPSNKTNVEYGDAKFVDQNGDGVVDQNSDRVILGSAQPKFTYGFASQLRYKNLDLSFNFQGSHGNKLYNQLEQALESPNASYNASAKLLNRWSETNPSNTIPRAYALNLYSTYLDSRYIEDASYLRLKNIQLGYNIKARFNSGAKLGIYVYASAQNLLTITDYTGFDPEYSGYVDRGTYPTARTFTFGVKLSY